MGHARNLFDVVKLIGDTMRTIVADHNNGPSMQGLTMASSFLVAGQIGESKYGKPVLDRILTYDTPLGEVRRCGLVSFDSTLRSNLSVGMPLDIAVYPTGSLEPPLIRRIDEHDSYFQQLRSGWSSGLKAPMESIEPPPTDYWQKRLAD